jgi:thiamine-monophosphate kinase
MAISEFELIARYFADAGASREDVLLGVGDDCALLSVPDGRVLAVSIDTLVEGVHFLPDTDPEALGHKVLAVNLSDLAAMGAEPAWVTLALTLPDSDPQWLERFSRGFVSLATRHGVRLVGGDTTRGPRTITVQVHGFVEPDRAICRGGARPGDHIYVTGTLGDAALALRAIEQSSGEDIDPFLRQRLESPQPRLGVGMKAVGLASAGIDISDGLLSDLGHICTASGVGAAIELDHLPLSEPMRQYIEQSGDWSLVLGFGDDYELCLVVPAELVDEFENRTRDLEVALSRVGTIEIESGIRCLLDGGALLEPLPGGYEHFRHES